MAIPIGAGGRKMKEVGFHPLEYTLEELNELISGQVITLEGSIGAGKTSAMDSWKRYIEMYQCDATSVEHLTSDTDPNKDFYLLVKEPVKEWDEARYNDTDARDAHHSHQIKTLSALRGAWVICAFLLCYLDPNWRTAILWLVIGCVILGMRPIVKPLEKISLLKAFYSKPAKYAFLFQVTAFTTRLRAFRDALRSLPPAARGRRIHLVTERTMETDDLFFDAVCQSYPGLEMERDSYKAFHQLICNALNRRTTVMIYLPVSVAKCQQRQRIRDRLSETECGIDVAYLQLLDRLHQSRAENFTTGRPDRRLVKLDAWEQEMSNTEIDTLMFDLIRKISN